MQEIKLSGRTLNGIQLSAFVDDEDYPLVSQYKWRAHKIKYTHYAVASHRHISMHRLIMNASKGTLVDHHNGVGIDCRRCNLRICTHTQNNRNSRKRKSTTCQYKGVCFDKSRNKWYASISCDSRNIFLGRFNNPVDAAKCYDAKAHELFGNFAQINFTNSVQSCE